MIEIPATLGGMSAESKMLILVALSFCLMVMTTRALMTNHEVLAAVYGVVGVLAAIRCLLIRRDWNRGATRLAWDGTSARVTHGENCLFEGEVSEMLKVMEDVRGYHLALDRKFTIRLRRSDVPQDLAARLDQRCA